MKPKPSISITIPEPCAQQREDMRPVTGGWHCDACRQKVVDFSLMSDGAILAFVKKAAGSHFCGSFQSSQLNRELIPPPKTSWRSHFSQRMAAALFLAQLTFTQAVAQSKKQVVKTAHAPQTIKGKPRIIQGRVLDYATQLPVAGARVKLLDTTVVTNKAGHFSMRIPASLSAGDVVLLEGQLAEGDKSGVILPEHVTLSGKQVHLVTLYQYPQEELSGSKATIVYYHPSHLSGVIQMAPTSSPVKEKRIMYLNPLPEFQPFKPPFFERLLKPFRRTHHREGTH